MEPLNNCHFEHSEKSMLLIPKRFLIPFGMTKVVTQSSPLIFAGFQRNGCSRKALWILSR